MINTILFDLDGTLLPFEQQEFVEMYFKLLCGQLIPRGYAPDDVIKGVWGGTKAMIKNDGTCLNRDRFWDVFAQALGDEVRESEDMLDAFYDNEFNTVKTVLRGSRPAKELVRMLRDKGYTVVLATNPLFPAVAQHTRLSWAGLTPQDFDYITHYQNSRFCKPNPRYYEEILKVIGKTPAECMMVGNSVPEDMLAASSLGIRTYLVTGFVENPEQLPTDAFEQGTLEEFFEIAASWENV